MALQHIAFIGTGIMGKPMAGHLLKAGYPVTVFTRTPSKADDLVAQGAQRASSIAEAVKDADVVITIVGFPAEVEEVYMATGGILEQAREGAILIDMSTSSPALARDIYQVAAVNNQIAIDAPVTGGEDGALAGTLTVMAGCDEETLARVRPIFETFGKTIVACGKAGNGQVTKLANQIAIANTMVAVAESLAFAKQHGIDEQVALQVLQSGSAASTPMKLLAPRAVAGNFAPGFMVKHLLKDLLLALEAADDLELTLPGTQGACELYDLLSTIKGADMGTQAITLLYDEEEVCKQHGLDWTLLGEEYDQLFEEEHEARDALYGLYQDAEDESLDDEENLLDHGECAHGHGHEHHHGHGHPHQHEHDPHQAAMGPCTRHMTKPE